MLLLRAYFDGPFRLKIIADGASETLLPRTLVVWHSLPFRQAKDLVICIIDLRLNRRKWRAILKFCSSEIFVTGLDTATLDSDSATRSRRSRAPSTICFSTVLVVRRYTGLTTGLFVPEKAHPILSSLQKWSCLSLFGEGPGWRFYGDVVAPYIYDMYFFQG